MEINYQYNIFCLKENNDFGCQLKSQIYENILRNLEQYQVIINFKKSKVFLLFIKYLFQKKFNKEFVEGNYGGFYF